MAQTKLQTIPRAVRQAPGHKPFIKLVIPERAVYEMAEQVADGYSLSHCQDYLLTSYGIQASLSVISRRLSVVRTERKQAAQTILTEKLAKTVGRDLALIDEAIERLRTEAYESMAAGKKDEANKLLRSMKDFIALRNDMAGTNNDEQKADSKDDETAEELIRSIAGQA